MRRRTEARKSQALALAIDASKSLARRRLRLRSEGTLDDPAAWQEFEANSVLRSLDDLDRPLAEFGKGSLKLWAGTGAISEEVAQPRDAMGRAARRRHDRRWKQPTGYAPCHGQMTPACAGAGSEQIARRSGSG